MDDVSDRYPSEGHVCLYYDSVSKASAWAMQEAVHTVERKRKPKLAMGFGETEASRVLLREFVLDGFLHDDPAKVGGVLDALIGRDKMMRMRGGVTRVPVTVFLHDAPCVRDALVTRADALAAIKPHHLRLIRLVDVSDRKGTDLGSTFGGEVHLVPDALDRDHVRAICEAVPEARVVHAPAPFASARPGTRRNLAKGMYEYRAAMIDEPVRTSPAHRQYSPYDVMDGDQQDDEDAIDGASRHRRQRRPRR